jgi:hypothetical protein
MYLTLLVFFLGLFVSERFFRHLPDFVLSRSFDHLPFSTLGTGKCSSSYAVFKWRFLHKCLTDSKS